jgi:site-specific recombinase XerD
MPRCCYKASVIIDARLLCGEHASEALKQLVAERASRQRLAPAANFSPAAQRACIDIHDLRHSAASNMVNSGQSLYVVGQVLGHAQPRTTQRYAHLSQDTLLNAADAGAAAAGW